MITDKLLNRLGKDTERHTRTWFYQPMYGIPHALHYMLTVESAVKAIIKTIGFEEHIDNIACLIERTATDMYPEDMRTMVDMDAGLIAAMTAIEDRVSSESRTEATFVDALYEFVCKATDPDLCRTLMLTDIGSPTNSDGKTFVEAMENYYAMRSAGEIAKAKAASEKEAAAKKSGMSMFPGMPGFPGGAAEETEMTADSAYENLKKYGKNLTEDVSSGKISPIVIGRDKEIEQITEVLEKMSKRNAILIGEPGVGKTAIAEGIAKNIVDGTINHALRDHTVFTIDINLIMSGAKYRGDVEERIKVIFDSLIFLQDKEGVKPIIFIDEIHQAIGQNAGDGSTSIANQLKPFMDRDGVKIIGGTTAQEYSKYIEKDKAFVRRFDKVIIEEPNRDDTIKILQAVAKKLEAFHEVQITEEAIVTATDLTNRFVKNLAQPDKGISIIDATAARAYCRGVAEVTSEMIAEMLGDRLGIDVSRMTMDERSFLADLETTINEKVIGQPQAVEQVADQIVMSSLGLREHGKTAGAFMLAGPTGVGKTYFVEVLAELLGRPFLRIDMSEYAEAYSTSKLWGAAPGYIGYGESAILVDQMKNKPTSIILLDEFEKAHQSLQDAFLQVLDAARMTTPQGLVIDFQNSMLFFTSNVGGRVTESTGFGMTRTKSSNTEKMMEAELQKAWRPEFRNRFDSVICFNHLELEDIKKIAKIELDKLVALCTAQGMVVTISDEVVTVVAENGYNKAMGARPMKRYINTNITKQIAKLAITDKDKNVFDIMVVDGKIVVE